MRSRVPGLECNAGQRVRKGCRCDRRVVGAAPEVFAKLGRSGDPSDPQAGQAARLGQGVGDEHTVVASKEARGFLAVQFSPLVDLIGHDPCADPVGLADDAIHCVLREDAPGRVVRIGDENEARPLVHPSPESV